MTPSDLAPIDSQQTAQHPRSREGELHVQPVDLLHEIEIGRRHRARKVVNRAARDADSLGLLGDAQRMISVDHRLALSNPALVSAPSKKLLPALVAPCGIETGHCYTAPGRERSI